MHATMTIAPPISEPLTWAQICERYPDQWVCLVEIDWMHPRQFAFRTARVVGHGKTRRAPFEQARPWREHYKLMGHYSTRQHVRQESAEPDCEVALDDTPPMRDTRSMDDGARRNTP